MLLVSRNSPYSRNRTVYSVGEATEESLSTCGRKNVDSLAENINTGAKFMGRLTGLLHAKGVLTDAEVLTLLSDYEAMEKVVFGAMAHVG